MLLAPFGFRVVGSYRNDRRLVDWCRAFEAYIICDSRCDPTKEAYLSAFTFGHEYRKHDAQHKTPKGFDGPCYTRYLWFDIDREGDIESATVDAGRLASTIASRYDIDGDSVLVFFSGSKGYHIGLASSLWTPQPSPACHRVARQFAEQLAKLADVQIDSGIYDKVRAIRAPNSRHPKTGLHKRRVEFDELLHVRPKAILDRARQPEAFELPDTPVQNQTAVEDWARAAKAAHEQMEAMVQRAATSGATLNRQTVEFICSGAAKGDRHRLLFSAAANLSEFGCPPELAHALLTEVALDSGLPPKEVKRQIDCGLKHNGGGAE